jgi:pyrroloquinoline quinone (PQQ) biosynthesis protein C
MNLSDRLDRITQQACDDIEALPHMQAMLSGELNREQYTAFLTNLYPIVSNFCPTMAFAAGLCADRYDVVRRYLYDHIFEEREHELLVLNDLSAFDVEVSDIPSRIPSPPVQAMLAYNYHYALSNPVYVLGFIYVLEILAFLYGGRVAHSVSTSMGRELDQGFTFLDSHAQLDEDHTVKLKNLFMSLNKTHDDVLLNSVETNFYLFKNIIGFNGKDRALDTAFFPEDNGSLVTC